MSMLGTVIICSNLVTGNSADNSWNYHEEFACSRRCHLLNSLLIVFCRVSGTNERQARAVHITVKLPPLIISNSKKTPAFRQRESHKDSLRALENLRRDLIYHKGGGEVNDQESVGHCF